MARSTTNSYKNLPIKTCKIKEGNITRKKGVSPTGGINEDAFYSNQVEKKVGEKVLVKLVSTSTNKDWIVVEPATAGDDKDHIVGFLDSDPFGVDDNTVSGEQPAVEDMRSVDIAFFGLAIIEFETTATSKPFEAVELSESETNKVGSAGALPTSNGGAVFLKYAVDGERVPILFGYCGYLPAD